MKTILVVDDEPKIVKLVRDYLERAGFEVRVAGNGKDALSQARSEKPELIILDLGLPQMTAWTLPVHFAKFRMCPSSC
jgi:DNA-binding response OmpR family regulator